MKGRVESRVESRVEGGGVEGREKRAAGPPEPRKVLFLVPALRIGGTERVVVTLVNGLDRARWKPEIAMVEEAGELAAELASDVKVHVLGLRRVRCALPSLVRLVRRRAPALVFSTMGYLNLVAAASSLFFRPPFSKGRGPRIAARESNLPSFLLRGDPAAPLYHILYRLLYRRLDAVVAQSGYMRRDLVESVGVPARLVTVLHNPVDTAAVLKKAAAGGDPYAADFAADSAAGSSAVRLAAVGRCNPKKGFATLLRTLALLEDRFHLTIVGDCENDTALAALASELGIEGRLSFAGLQSNPYPWIFHADVLVLASRYEGFPNVAIEALTCGTPVAAFSGPCSTGEIVRPGIDGYLADYGNTEALAEAVRRTAGAGLNAQRIREDARRRFGLDTIIRRYESFFEEVCGR